MSSSLKITNGAIGKLAAGITASATTLVLVPGDGAKFPTLTTGQWFPATIVKSTGAFEIVRVTARATDTLTVVRAQEATVGQTFLAGDRVELRFTAGAFSEEISRIEGIGTAAQSTANAALPKAGGTMTGPIVLPGNPSTNLQAAPKQYVDQRAAAAFPSGGIIMWSGAIANIPTGWLLCNGANGTPDLRDRFIIGASQDQAGQSMSNVTGSLTKTGGSKDAIVVSHTHSFSGTVASRSITGQFRVGGPNQSPDGTVFTAGGDTGARPGLDFASGSQHIINFNATHDHTMSGTNASTGSSGTNANLPPYYALAFIMKA